MHKPLVVLDAPSNLGLRPPQPGVVPGVYKLAGALRDQQIVPRLGARDGGVVTPPRYLPDTDGRTIRNQTAIATYSRRLADRVQAVILGGAFPLVLGGDCSIVLGDMLALRRSGVYGLAFIDGHLDFRHLGNSDKVGSAAGEDLALVTGRGAPELTDLEGLGPLARDEHVVAIGFRSDDPHSVEVRAAGITAIDAAQVRQAGPSAVGREAIATFERRGVAGYWIHLDADVLDAALMPAVDSPEPGGLTFQELSELLRELLGSERVSGLEITIFDPDLDPDGQLAKTLAEAVIAAFATARAS